MTINDAKKANLLALGFTGSIDDAYKAYLVSLTGVNGVINDLEKRVFVAAGFTGALNDMWMQHFVSQGITSGAYNDRMLVAWKTLPGAGLNSSALANLLLEDGFDLLQEDGSLFVL